VRDYKTNGVGYGAGPVLRGFEEVAAALRGFVLGSGVQAGAELQQVSGKTLAAFFQHGMSTYFVSGNGGLECPLISSKIAGAPVLRGLQGSDGFAPSVLSPLISPWARELFHLSLIYKYCFKSIRYEF
jgi:hypothetical protein